MKGRIRINQGRVLNSWFRYVGTLIGICSIVVTVAKLNNVTGFVLVCAIAFLMIMMWTSFHVLEIDMSTKTYNDHTVVLGRGSGDSGTFSSIEKVFINEVGFTTASNRYSTGERTVHSGREFKAYVKFDTGEKLFLISDEDYNALVERLQPIVKKLNTEIK